MTDNPLVQTEARVLIAQTLDRVWTVLTDFHRAPLWIKNTLLKLEGELYEGAELYFSFPRHPRFPGRLTRLRPLREFGINFATRDFLFTLRALTPEQTEVCVHLQTPVYPRFGPEQTARGNAKLCQAMLRQLQSLLEGGGHVQG
jgi:uncharacterized protein YndB with AHSA1/START domain